MTLRDEIAKALAASNSWMLAHECRDSADALLPIVERVARNTIEAYKRSGLSCADQECEACRGAIDAIVARVMEGGE